MVALAAADGSPEEYGTVLALTGLTLLTLGRAHDAATVMAAATTLYPVDLLARSAGRSEADLQDRLTETLGADRLAEAWEAGSALTERETRDATLRALATAVSDP